MSSVTPEPCSPMGQLLDSDLELLARAAGEPPGAGQRLRGAPQRLEALLASPAVFKALFGPAGRDPFLVASPLLVFSVLVQRVSSDLQRASFVQEWLGPGRSVPLFDVESLRSFLAPGTHRGFLAELLSSYTRVASGSIWERTARGWRRRRYSDLDPVRLAQLLEAASPEARGSLYRRLGDLALFLSGVFPEHVAAHPLAARDLEMIGRCLHSSVPGELAQPRSPQKGLWVLDWLGRRAYRVAGRAAGSPPELQAIVGGFGQARRVLNLLTGRYLYPSREGWFRSVAG